jgi:DNA-binding transcriptional MocR family regulator
MPPGLACKFSISELAVLNIVADEVLKTGTCRLKVERIAERAHVSRRTVQNALREARLRQLLLIRRRRLTRTLSLPNIVIIVSKEWLQWIKRRGAWTPASRSIDWRALREASNKGAKRFAPQVSIYKKERGEREKLDNVEVIRRSIFGARAAGPP